MTNYDHYPLITTHGGFPIRQTEDGFIAHNGPHLIADNVESVEYAKSAIDEANAAYREANPQ